MNQGNCKKVPIVFFFIIFWHIQRNAVWMGELNLVHLVDVYAYKRIKIDVFVFVFLPRPN